MKRIGGTGRHFADLAIEWALGSCRNLTIHGDGALEECRALIQLGSQKAHLRQKGIAFCGLKLKLEVQPPNVFIVPPCVCTLLCYREGIVRR